MYICIFIEAAKRDSVSYVRIVYITCERRDLNEMPRTGTMTFKP